MLEVFIRQGGRLTLLPVVGSFDSPLLGIRFVLRREGLIVQDATGQPFRMLNEERAHRERAEAQARQERTGREAAEARTERLLARLRALGLMDDTAMLSAFPYQSQVASTG